MANAESAILKEIMQSEPTILRKDMLMAFFREAARTTGADRCGVWDDLFPLQEIPLPGPRSVYARRPCRMAVSLAIEGHSHFFGSDTYDANLVNAKRFLGISAATTITVIARGDVRWAELIGDPRTLRRQAAEAGEGDSVLPRRVLPEVSNGNKTVRFSMSIIASPGARVDYDDD
jgi:hypothetical protein